MLLVVISCLVVVSLPKKTKNKVDDRQDEANFLDKLFNPSKDENSDAENISLIVKEWLNPEHTRFKTRYSKSQIVAISIFQSLADTYKIKTLERFLYEYRTAKLSEDSKSSEELTDILVARMSAKDDMSGLEKLGRYLE